MNFDPFLHFLGRQGLLLKRFVEGVYKAKVSHFRFLELVGTSPVGLARALPRALEALQPLLNPC